MNRREFLQATGVAVSSLALAGCGITSRRLAEKRKPHQGDALVVPEPDVRLINRIGYGVSRSDMESYQALGRAGYVDRQLAADQPDDEALGWAMNGIDVVHIQSSELGDYRMEDILMQLQKFAIVRAVYSPNQLEERMVDFWTNHFNIFARIKDSFLRKPQDEIVVIRKNALGKFPDMLRASAHSGAMLIYLDAQMNEKGRPNENYAREIMELHSLGVNSGYTQNDVAEVARCLTGWTVENRFLHARGTAVFRPELHDDGSKLVLGHRIPAKGGEKDIERVLEILATHPYTAHFIAKKLCTHFLGSKAEKWIAPTAKTYLETGGDIRAMLRPILMSQELLDSEPLLKRPFDYVISSLRVLEAVTDGGYFLQKHLEAMGQPLYQWPMPDGFPTKTKAWTGSMLARWNYALALVEGRIRTCDVGWEVLNLNEREHEIIPTVLARSANYGRAGIDRSLNKAPTMKHKVAACLMAPEFQWR